MKFSQSNYSNEVLYDVGHLKWIELIRNAEFRYTDSYDGVLFSLKYNKKFIEYYVD